MLSLSIRSLEMNDHFPISLHSIHNVLGVLVDKVPSENFVVLLEMSILKTF